MSSRRLLLERHAPNIKDLLSPCFSTFLDHFHVLSMSGTSTKIISRLGSADELLGWLMKEGELEMFVLCLLRFGYYSMAYKFFNELDFERLSQHHKNFTLNIDLFTRFGQDLTDKCLQSNDKLSAIMSPSPFQRHRHLILCKLDVLPVFNYFYANGLLYTNSVGRFQSQEWTQERLIKFIEYIEGESSIFVHFYHALLLSGQFELFAFVVDEQMQWESLDTLGTQQRHALLDAWNRQQENIVPAPAIEWEEKEDEPVFEFSVDMPDTTTAKNLDYYRGNKENIYQNFSVPKGLVLIINNQNFNCDLNPRIGTMQDEASLRKLFNDLGYTTMNTCHDLTGTEMLATARQFTKRPEHSKAHSCIVVVMTHGEYDQLIGVDGSTICTHEFTALFNSANAPLLAGKPKFFIIQACRGGIYDAGVHVPVPIDQTDHSFFNSIKRAFVSPSQNQRRQSQSSFQSPTQPPSVLLNTMASIEINRRQPSVEFDSERHRLVKQPTEADIIIAYATVPRYVSWRNSARGSWFVQSICKVFAEHAKNKDLVTLLTLVNDHVSQVYQSTDPSQSKQIPEFSCRLRRKFYLFPGIVSEE